MCRTWILWASAAALAAACDPSAKANRNEPPPDRLSKQHERCAASADCAEGLRCFEDVCVATDRSRLGDFYWALGERRLAADEIDAAVEAYGKAVGQYEATKGLEVPPALYCDQGHALIAAKEDPVLLEQGALVLHKCFLAATPGSTLYTKALAGFAVLIDNGLDPMLLARDDEATKYLTKGPRRPPTEDVRLTVTSSSNTRAASHGALISKLQAPDVRELLLPCWEQNWKEAKEKTLTVTVPFEYKYVRGVYEEDDRYVLSLDGAAAPAAGTSAAAAQCVNAVVEPIVADFRGPGGSFEAKMTFTME